MLEQSHHPAATNSIQCMHKLALVEHDQQPVQRLCRVARSRANVFFQDASCVLYGAQQRMLVRAIHRLTQTCNNTKMRDRVSSFPRAKYVAQVAATALIAGEPRPAREACR